jgi:hypothetical protein
LPAPGNLPFPHVNQVFLIERYVIGQPISAVAALGVARPKPEQAGVAGLAGYVREQWSIESLHWIRDTYIKRTNPRSEPDPGPESWLQATSRLGALRLAGRIDVTEATRWTGRSMDRPFTTLRARLPDLRGKNQSNLGCFRLYLPVRLWVGCRPAFLCHLL